MPLPVGYGIAWVAVVADMADNQSYHSSDRVCRAATSGSGGGSGVSTDTLEALLQSLTLSSAQGMAPGTGTTYGSDKISKSYLDWFMTEGGTGTFSLVCTYHMLASYHSSSIIRRILIYR
jgi:hypothetical protein